MPRNTAITATPTENQIEAQPKNIVRRRTGAIEQQPQQPQGMALAIEELELNFDPDLRLAIIQRIVNNSQLIKQEVTQERQLTKALELARLEATNQAKNEGIQQARAEFAEKKKKEKAAAQQHFIKVELDQLIDGCLHLPYETMKATINAFAARLDIKLNWEELENGEFKCTPVTGG